MRGQILLGALVASTLAAPAVAEPTPVEIASCAAFFHVFRSDPAPEGPYYLSSGSDDLTYAFYSEAFLAFDEDQTGLNDQIDLLVPDYIAMKSAHEAALAGGAVSPLSKQWLVEKGRCDALGATRERTRKFYFIQVDPNASPFPYPTSGEADLDHINYAIGWFGASCLGYRLAVDRVTQETLQAENAPKQTTSVKEDINQLLDLETSWRQEDLLFHTLDRTGYFTPAARIILPLNAAKQDLPEAQVEIMRTGQFQCQQFQTALNQRELIRARTNAP